MPSRPPPMNGRCTREGEPHWTLAKAFKTKWVPEDESNLTDDERQKRYHFSKVVKLETFTKALKQEKAQQAIQEMELAAFHGDSLAVGSITWQQQWQQAHNRRVRQQPLQRIQWLEGEIYKLEHDEEDIPFEGWKMENHAVSEDSHPSHNVASEKINTRSHYNHVWHDVTPEEESDAVAVAAGAKWPNRGAPPFVPPLPPRFAAAFCAAAEEVAMSSRQVYQ